MPDGRTRPQNSPDFLSCSGAATDAERHAAAAPCESPGRPVGTATTADHGAARLGRRAERNSARRGKQASGTAGSERRAALRTRRRRRKMAGTKQRHLITVGNHYQCPIGGVKIALSRRGHCAGRRSGWQVTAEVGEKCDERRRDGDTPAGRRRQDTGDPERRRQVGGRVLHPPRTGPQTPPVRVGEEADKNQSIRRNH